MLYFCTIFHTNFYTVFSYIFLLFYWGFRLYFNRIFTLHFRMNFYHILYKHFSPFFAEVLHYIRPYFYEIFSPFFAQIRLPRLFCFYNLTKHSSYTLLHAVPLKQWFWLYYLNFFLMQNPSYNVSDCPLFCHLVLSLFLRLFIVILFLYCHQLLSYVFSLNNSSVQQQTRMINVPWDAACYTRPLYSYLVALWPFASARLFSVFSFSGLFLCICLCQAFSVFCLLWPLCSLLAGNAVL